VFIVFRLWGLKTIPVLFSSTGVAAFTYNYTFILTSRQPVGRSVSFMQ
jgi:hypothetical protein